MLAFFKISKKIGFGSSPMIRAANVVLYRFAQKIRFKARQKMMFQCDMSFLISLRKIVKKENSKR